MSITKDLNELFDRIIQMPPKSQDVYYNFLKETLEKKGKNEVLNTIDEKNIITNFDSLATNKDIIKYTGGFSRLKNIFFKMTNEEEFKESIKHYAKKLGDNISQNATPQISTPQISTQNATQNATSNAIKLTKPGIGDNPIKKLEAAEVIRRICESNSDKQNKYIDFIDRFKNNIENVIFASRYIDFSKKYVDEHNKNGLNLDLEVLVAIVSNIFKTETNKNVIKEYYDDIIKKIKACSVENKNTSEEERERQQRLAEERLLKENKRKADELAKKLLEENKRKEDELAKKLLEENKRKAAELKAALEKQLNDLKQINTNKQIKLNVLDADNAKKQTELENLINGNETKQTRVNRLNHQSIQPEYTTKTELKSFLLKNEESRQNLRKQGTPLLTQIELAIEEGNYLDEQIKLATEKQTYLDEQIKLENKAKNRLEQELLAAAKREQDRLVAERLVAERQAAELAKRELDNLNTENANKQIELNALDTENANKQIEVERLINGNNKIIRQLSDKSQSTKYEENMKPLQDLLLTNETDRQLLKTALAALSTQTPTPTPTPLVTAKLNNLTTQIELATKKKKYLYDLMQLANQENARLTTELARQLDEEKNEKIKKENLEKLLADLEGENITKNKTLIQLEQENITKNDELAKLEGEINNRINQQQLVNDAEYIKSQTELKTKNKGLKEEKDVKKQENDQIQLEIAREKGNNLVKQIDLATKKRNNLVKQIDLATEEGNNLDNQIQLAQERLEQETERLKTEAAAAAAKELENLQNLQKELENLDIDNANKQKELNKLYTDNANKQKELNKLYTDNNEIKNQLTKQSQFTQYEENITKLKDFLSTNEIARQLLKTELDKLQTQLVTAKLDNIQKQIKLATEENNYLDNQIQLATEEGKNIDEQIGLAELEQIRLATEEGKNLDNQIQLVTAQNSNLDEQERLAQKLLEQEQALELEKLLTEIEQKNKELEELKPTNDKLNKTLTDHHTQYQNIKGYDDLYLEYTKLKLNLYKTRKEERTTYEHQLNQIKSITNINVQEKIDLAKQVKTNLETQITLETYANEILNQLINFLAEKTLLELRNLDAENIEKLSTLNKLDAENENKLSELKNLNAENNKTQEVIELREQQLQLQGTYNKLYFEYRDLDAKNNNLTNERTKLAKQQNDKNDLIDYLDYLKKCIELANSLKINLDSKIELANDLKSNLDSQIALALKAKAEAEEAAAPIALEEKKIPELNFESIAVAVSVYNRLLREAEAEKQRQLDAEAEEEEEKQRQLDAEAEKQRQLDAEAEAEKQRLAELKAKKDAEEEAKRIAALALEAKLIAKKKTDEDAALEQKQLKNQELNFASIAVAVSVYNRLRREAEAEKQRLAAEAEKQRQLDAAAEKRLAATSITPPHIINKTDNMTLVELVNNAINPVKISEVLSTDPENYAKYLNQIIDKITSEKIENEFKYEQREDYFKILDGFRNILTQDHSRVHESLADLYVKIFNKFDENQRTDKIIEFIFMIVELYTEEGTIIEK